MAPAPPGLRPRRRETSRAADWPRSPSCRDHISSVASAVHLAGPRTTRNSRERKNGSIESRFHRVTPHVQPGGCLCLFVLNVQETKSAVAIDQTENGSTSSTGEKRAIRELGWRQRMGKNIDRAGTNAAEGALQCGSLPLLPRCRRLLARRGTSIIFTRDCQFRGAFIVAVKNIVQLPGMPITASLTKMNNSPSAGRPDVGLDLVVDSGSSDREKPLRRRPRRSAARS